MVYSVLKDYNGLIIYGRQNGHCKRVYYIYQEDYKRISTILFLKGVKNFKLDQTPLKIWEKNPEYVLPKDVFRVIKPHLVRKT